MKTLMYLMANDVKWVEREEELDFFPFHGLDFIGIAGEQSLRINSVSWDIQGKFFKVRLSWLSPDPMTSSELINLNVGWKLKT